MLHVLIYMKLLICVGNKLLLTLKAASHAGIAVGAVSDERTTVSKDKTVLLLFQVGEPGAGRGLETQLFTLIIS